MSEKKRRAARSLLDRRFLYQLYKKLPFLLVCIFVHVSKQFVRHSVKIHAHPKLGCCRGEEEHFLEQPNRWKGRGKVQARPLLKISKSRG